MIKGLFSWIKYLFKNKKETYLDEKDALIEKLKYISKDLGPGDKAKNHFAAGKIYTLLNERIKVEKVHKVEVPKNKVAFWTPDTGYNLAE